TPIHHSPPPLPPPTSNSSSQTDKQLINHQLLTHHPSRTSTSLFTTAFNSTLCRILLTSYLHRCKLMSQAVLNTADQHTAPRTAISAVQAILKVVVSPVEGSKIVTMMILKDGVS
ncbi:hypothetical protein QBC45DRAFT_288452, partial [Copromyces sp. CBS 386.78]